MNQAARRGLLLLDTNVLLHYARGKATGLWLREHYQLADNPGRLLTCRVVIGEVLAFVAKGKATNQPWGKAKMEHLHRILEASHIIELSDPGVCQAYADICVFSEVTTKPARSMQGADLWIAAAAKVSGATLLTSDPDFNHLHGHMISVETYDPNQQ